MRVSEAEQVVDEILNRVGKRVVLATQLGLGKPVQILNALYRRAKNDPRLHLTIITGLTLLRPKIKNDLGQRLLGPYLARVFGDYEDLQFELDRRACALPSNVRVIEFFFTAAAYLHNAKAQQNFICSNYTHVVRDGLQYGINVVAMVLAERATDRRRLSMSCNADLINDLLQKMKGIMVVGEINHNLPYMFGSEVEIEAAQVDAILENQHSHRHLFSLPKVMVTDQEFMIGLYVSSLIKDDGCLQIGIGSLNDAIVYSLIMRHTKNQQYTDVFESLGIAAENARIFAQGLCALTEMLTDGYLDLYLSGILKKKISDEAGDCVAHAGFFIGSNEFYARLKNMTDDERRLFSMRSISELNQLYGDEEKRRRQRKNARYVNTCIKVSLLGAMASDGLDDGKTISGVGGQYNFVAMAHELEGARSIIMCRSTHGHGQNIESNIVFTYGNTTVARHLRDIVVTEYGIGDLRGKTDEEVVKAMLNITDSRYQPALLKKAKSALKIPQDYEIPPQYRRNSLEQIASQLAPHKASGLFAAFPFGHEFSEDEVSLLGLLRDIETFSLPKQLQTALTGMTTSPTTKELALLDRMNLKAPTTLKNHFHRYLLLGAMTSSHPRT